MKLLKAIFTNALVMVTLVTAVAGTILVAYAGDEPRPVGKASGAVGKAADAVSHVQTPPYTR